MSLRAYNFPILPNLSSYTKVSCIANHFIHSLSESFYLLYSPFFRTQELVTEDQAWRIWLLRDRTLGGWGRCTATSLGVNAKGDKEEAKARRPLTAAACSAPSRPAGARRSLALPLGHWPVIGWAALGPALFSASY